jgi:hypothetical protein
MARGLMARRVRADVRGPVGLVTGLLAGVLLVWSWTELADPATSADRVEASAVPGQPSPAARASARMRSSTTIPVAIRPEAPQSFPARAAARSRSSRVGPADRARAQLFAARRAPPNSPPRRDWVVAADDGR